MEFETVPRRDDDGDAPEKRARVGGLPFPQARDVRSFAALRAQLRETRYQRVAAFGEFGVEIADERLRLLAEGAAQTGLFRAADLARPMVLQDRENPAEDKEEDDQPPFDEGLLRAGVHGGPAFTARRIVAV